MAERPENLDDLDFLSFIDFAVDRTTSEIPEVDPKAMRLGLGLTRVASAMIYDLEAEVHRPSGWSWPGFRILFVLWLAGPSDAKRVARLSGASRAAVSALVNTLERDGLVHRRRSSTDRRAVELSLTEAGREVITDTYIRHNQREQTWAKALTGPEQTILIGLLEKLAQAATGTDVHTRE
ncbi:MarR family transcriptional regulator [Rhodococcus sp. Z13]|uniref:MarR family transcriptional regulator n=1 Tax=Rhodococcus sacchari TaxID=2962047 RepID=A0ACD4DF47_9NOCA|nr:MarR family transcriptional regulator [Rhodococcus sp. Z13]UYP18604.1 MarR family transcriptional regulator [Rhodococcus sp. Z13]